VFTPARISVLELLASQAAISLENARLYNDLRQRETRIRRLVDANIIGMMIWAVDGQITEANEAFLGMLGYRNEDLVSGRLQRKDLTPAEWRDADDKALARLRRLELSSRARRNFSGKTGAAYRYSSVRRAWSEVGRRLSLSCSICPSTNARRRASGDTLKRRARARESRHDHGAADRHYCP
jgi:PAS domain S-box-containing protein